jgi:hypothetical protein
MTTTNGVRYWRTQRDHACCETHLPNHARIWLAQYPGITNLPHQEHDLTWVLSDRPGCDECWWARHKASYD